MNKERLGVTNSRRELVRPAGLEPATFGSGGQRSIQLSYGREVFHHTSRLVLAASLPDHSPGGGQAASHQYE
jgi:hypothetical protein